MSSEAAANATGSFGTSREVWRCDKLGIHVHDDLSRKQSKMISVLIKPESQYPRRFSAGQEDLLVRRQISK
jgi:hypothetical protein